MQFVIYDKGSGMYISDATKEGFKYSDDVDKAKVYKSRKGAMEAVGEPDKSYKSIGKKHVPIKVPERYEIRTIGLNEEPEQKSPYDTTAYKGLK